MLASIKTSCTVTLGHMYPSVSTNAVTECSMSTNAVSEKSTNAVSEKSINAVSECECKCSSGV